MSLPSSRTTLVIGHPGHELRVFHWLETNQPSVFVLTDGSGRSGVSRLASTTKIVDRVGATKGSVYGDLTDSALYSAMLNDNHSLFIDFARKLSEHLSEQGIEYVVGDALEGYNPTHDICRLIIDTAVALVERAGNRTIKNLDFSLTNSPEHHSRSSAGQLIRIQLDQQAYERKISAALEYEELRLEVEKAIRDQGPSAFKVECLRPVSNHEVGAQFSITPPYYETHGEARVAAGHYFEVIRFRRHFLPLAHALQQYVQENSWCPV